MTSIVERLLKRRCCPVEINGQEFHVAGLTIGDRRRLDKIEDPVLKSFYIVGRGLCEPPDGTPCFTQNTGETDVDFATRIESLLQEISSDTLSELTMEIARVGRVPTSEKLQKN